MPESTVLLITTDPTVIEEVQAVQASIHHLHLEVYADVETARGRLERDPVTAVLVHLTPSTDDAEVTRLLGMTQATPRRIGTIVLADPYQDRQARTLLREIGRASCRERV